jgi:hypothetical protein
MPAEDAKPPEAALAGENLAAAQQPPETTTLPSTEFIKVEKNLTSLGFFTPTSKRLRNSQGKTFTLTTNAGGTRIEMRGSIIPSVKYGLPVTADQDKWLALCKILTDILQKEGRVTNPVSFTSAQILRLLEQSPNSGKNYKSVAEWLDVLYSTTIISEGIVYLANEKRYAKDRFRVFDRAVSLGKELPDGTTASKNYVWFSEWQLQNINSNHLLPIDLETYRLLKNHIAKVLVPLLQIWLFATRKQGVFEKRYDELCQILNIRQYRYLSLIKQTLGPSLDELVQFNYLASWQIEKTANDEHYKIIFHHGPKFHRDRNACTAHAAPKPPRGSRQQRLNLKSANEAPPPPPPVDEALVAELVQRGIGDLESRKLLAKLAPGQPVAEQLEYADAVLRNPKNGIRNAQGFYISRLLENFPVPEHFETSAKRKLREAAELRQREAFAERQAIELAYDEYRREEIDRYIAAHVPAPEFAALVKREIAKRRRADPRSAQLPAETQAAIADRAVRSTLAEQIPIPIPTIEEFREREWIPHQADLWRSGELYQK